MTRSNIYIYISGVQVNSFSFFSAIVTSDRIRITKSSFVFKKLPVLYATSARNVETSLEHKKVVKI